MELGFSRLSTVSLLLPSRSSGKFISSSQCLPSLLMYHVFYIVTLLAPLHIIQKAFRFTQRSLRTPRYTILLVLSHEYTDLTDVFSISNATLLLPHRLWDCAIDLALHPLGPGSIHCWRLRPKQWKITWPRRSGKVQLASPHPLPLLVFLWMPTLHQIQSARWVTVMYLHPLPLIPLAIDQFPPVILLSSAA